MPPFNPPPLAGVLKSVHNQVGTSVLVVLAWLMNADGEEAPEEQEILAKIAESAKLDHVKEDILRITRSGNLDSIELACEILHRELDSENKRRLIELYIGMLLADGYISLSEQYVIGFIADLFAISPDELNTIFQEITGKDLPPPGNPSSTAWWEKKERHRRQQGSSGDGHRQSSTKRVKALATLGLEEGASRDEIRQAYRRLARIHHPDRYQTLGPEAVKVANATFARINEAYEYLTKA